MEKRDETPAAMLNAPDEARLTDIAYHKKFNLWAAIFGSGFFIFFDVFHFRLKNYFQSFLFVLLFVNTVVAVWLSGRIKGVKKLVRLKRISTAIAFGLLAICILDGVWSDNIYIAFPWIFFYPMAIMFMFGRRIGIYGTIVYSMVMMIAVLVTDFPAWDEINQNMFKFNSVLAIFVASGVALISERARIRIQDDLVAAQNKYKHAEQRQREINATLQQ